MDEVQALLSLTLASIAAQTDTDWECYVVAEEGMELPKLPRNTWAIRSNIPPQTTLAFGDRTRAVRRDKGLRLFAGLSAARPSGHVMFVDHDDWVHRNLAWFANSYPESSGWFVGTGLIYGGGYLALGYDQFHRICGTSHIVNSRVLKMQLKRREMDYEWIDRTLGSHKFLKGDLDRSETPLALLPFAGAVYLVGHSSADTGPRSLPTRFFHPLKTSPRTFVGRILRLKRMTRSRLSEFLPESVWELGQASGYVRRF